MSSAKKILTANLLFVIFLAIMASILIVLAVPENTMDVDTAQTLLSARYFARDGFLKHYFLQLPSGYGKITQYFEELQQHAGGDVNGSLIGKKLYYTHFPSFYIIPTALMMKLGIENLFSLRLLYIIFSLLSLTFLYVFIKIITNKYIGFIAVLYFDISQNFLAYAKVINFVPVENMLRFLILMLSIFAINHIKSATASSKITRRYILSIWLFYFLLAITSYNSTFFIFAYLVGLSTIYIYKLPISHKIRTLSLLVILWASAPVLGFALQVIPNMAYLGWHNFWLDIKGAFIASGNSSKISFISRITDYSIRPFVIMSGLYNFYILTVWSPYSKIQSALSVLYSLPKIKRHFLPSSTPIAFILPFMIALVIVAFYKLKKISGYVIHSLEIPTLLLIASFAQTLLLPIGSVRDDAASMTAPIIGIIIGSLVWMLFLAFSKVKFGGKILIIFMSVMVLSLFAVQIVLDTSSYFGPNHIPLSNNEISFAKNMQKVAEGEKAVFMVNTFDTQLSEAELKHRFATIDPKEFVTHYRNYEYYFDMPLLNFTKTSYLVKDLLYLKKRADFPFTAIITSDNLDLINELRLNLKHLSLTPVKVVSNMNLIPKDLPLADTRYYFLVEK